MALPLDIARRIQAGTPAQAWQAALDYSWSVCAEAVAAESPAKEVMKRDRRLYALDLYLATAAYDLWPQMESCAPSNSKALAAWWAGGSPGRSILILDALSLREVPWLLHTAPLRGYTIHSAQVHVSEMPGETTPFAKSLGFAQRASLAANGAGVGHCFHGAKTETLGIPWSDAVAYVPSSPDFVLWHQWPDDRIHSNDASLESLAKEAAQQLTGDDFWKLLDRLTTGRRLVITSDHGYAATGEFHNTDDEDQAAYLKQTFQSGRVAASGGPSGAPWLPPVDLQIQSAHGVKRLVLGRRKWKSQHGYPKLAHGGLSILEVAVPFIELSRP
jgi:hypothetical protein